ncbi:MAG: DUF5666 domain-containing protein [Ardenticatenales bacterium]
MQVALGLGLAVLVGLVEVGLYRSAGSPARPEGLGAPAAPRSLAVQAPAQAPAPPGADLLPTPTCRVVGFMDKAPAGEPVIWGTVTNVGAVATTIDGVEIGWAGEATLREVQARGGPGETTKTLFGGKASSPFFATLDAGWPLAPGESAQVGFRFEWPNQDAPWLLKAAVVHLHDGCRAVLRPRADSPVCPVHTTDLPHVPASARNRVEITVENTGQKEDSITALEITWPVATNGRLLKVTVDGAELIDLKDGLNASPATLPLARMREDGIVVAPGKPRAIGFVFEKPAAVDGYSIQGSTRRGCALSSTTGLAAWDCGISAGDVQIDGDVARYKISDPRDIDRTVTDLTLFWPTAANGPLVSVAVDGQPVWRGEQRDSPVSVPLGAPIRVPAGGSVDIVFRFRPPAAAGTGPQLASGAYTMVVALDGGCQTAFTNRAAVGQCDLSAGELVSLVEPTSHNMQVDVYNNGDDVRLATLHLAWPAANGAIRGIRWGGTAILNGPPLAWAAQGVTFTVPTGVGALLAQGGQASLAVDFDEAPVPDDYSFALGFANRRGDPCQTVLVTRQAAPGRGVVAPCEAALVGPRFGAARTQLLFDLTNRGLVAGALLGLDINVAQFDPLSPLETILAERANGETRTIWSNEPLRRPPYTVSLDDPLTLGAGESVTLRFQFAATFQPTGRAEEIVTVRADLGDGCEIWNTPPGVEPPSSTLLSGVIAQLPDPLQGCCWVITRWDNDVANREVKVDVDGNTVLEPASVTPRVGDPVNVTALARGDGSLYAQRIGFQRRGTQVKVAGTIARLGPPSATRPGLPDWFVVEGRLVSLVDSTRIVGDLAEGTRVFVTGTPSGGTIVAGTVDAADAKVAELLSRRTVEGFLVRTDGQGPDRTWTIGTTPVLIGADTKFYDSKGAPAADPGDLPRGTPLRAEGPVEGGAPNVGATGAVRADSVWLLPNMPTMRIAGTIVQIPPAGQVGEWKVDARGKGTITFYVRSMAVVDTRIAPAQAGNQLTAILQQADDGSWLALQLRTDWGQ